MTRRAFLLAGLGLLGVVATGGIYSYVHLPPSFSRQTSGPPTDRWWP